MKAIVLGTAVLVAAAAAPLGAANGVLMVQQTTSGDTKVTSQVQIEPTRMRAEMVTASGATQAIVFDGDRQVMILINAERKSYSEITKADIDRVAGQVQDMMAKVPPEMRAKVEAMMKGRGMAIGGAAPKTEYKRAGTDKAGKWTCDRYEGFVSGQKTSELCTVTPNALGLTAADFAVTKQFMAFFEKLIPQAVSQIFAIGETQDQGFSGVPVKSTSTAGGRTTTELTEISRQTFADSVFAVPAGFQREASPFGRGK